MDILKCLNKKNCTNLKISSSDGILDLNRKV